MSKTKAQPKKHRRNWTHTSNQAELLTLYSNGSRPKLGVEEAIGLLHLGEPVRVGKHFERAAIESPYTLYNIADHLGYTLVRTRFTNQILSANIGVPDEISKDMSNGAKAACYTDVERLRQYFSLFGYDGIPCYLYFAWKLRLNVNEKNGAVEFARSEQQLLSLIPIDPNLAVKRFAITEEQLAAMAVSVGFIVKKRLRHRSYQLTERSMSRGAPEVGVPGMGTWKELIAPEVMTAILKVAEQEDEQLLNKYLE